MFLFDLFPVELLQSIFRYLWAHEILHGFLNQSDYLNSVLHNYDRYAINLCSMTKNQFDQICYQIHPKQVFAIIFMDENDTPELSTLFFSHFNIQEFVNLRSFAIVSSDQSLFRKLDFLCQFNKFKSLVIPQISEAYWCLCNSYVEPMLSQLKCLVTNEYRLTKPLKNLQHLTVTHCYCYKLQYILPLVINLQSLNITISLDIFPFWTKKIPIMNNLKKFILHVRYGRLTMGQIQEVLLKLPCLIHFEVELEDPFDVIGGKQWQTWTKHLNVDIEGAMDIIDGNQWKYIVSQLRIFDFRFYFLKAPAKKILDSFQTPFWLEEKRWFVAFDDCPSSPCLYTVPRFVVKTVAYSLDYHPVACTSTELHPDQFIKTLQLPMIRPLTHNFPNVTSLILETNEDLDRTTILPYFQLPHLQSLSFSNLSLLDVLSPDLIFQSIRELNVMTTVSTINAEQIRVIFPRLERLRISTDDKDTILSLIDGLKYLSICKFIHCSSSSISTFTQDWFLEHSLRLKTNNRFTYRHDGENIHLWMNSE